MNNDYSVWIEAEEWAEGEWQPDDDNTDVIITFNDSSRWVATFFSYSNISSLTAKYKESGECLSGKYFWASDMILVDEVSRQAIEEVIQHLIETEEFPQIFKAISDESTDSLRRSTI